MSILIAIDGPSGAGKGFLSQALCEKYSFAFLDTGLLFRATALKSTLKGVAVDDNKGLIEIVKNLEPSDFEPINELRSEINGQVASKIAVLPKVRAALVSYMRNFAEKRLKQGVGAVLDGRDIGTIVYPQADLKFFMTATPEERAKRRLKELQNRGIPVIFEEVLQEMIQRDRRDRERQDSPLMAAEDAIIIDTSDMSPADVVALASEAIDKALA
ncbi:MAG TPA: (d)CMP kinase [Holosporales bacterium]|nr:(d)CMP kinase [Holosporales bacterium]